MNFKLKSSRDEPSFQILQQLWEKENLPTDLTKFLFCQMTTWVEKKKKITETSWTYILHFSDYLYVCYEDICSIGSVSINYNYSTPNRIIEQTF